MSMVEQKWWTTSAMFFKIGIKQYETFWIDKHLLPNPAKQSLVKFFIKQS
jgi:hypothetical protein